MSNNNNNKRILDEQDIKEFCLSLKTLLDERYENQKMILKSLGLQQEFE